MPNHCRNRWTITGDKLSRDRLVEILETTDEKDDHRGSDFINPYDSEEEEWEKPTLVPALAEFQELFDMSG